MNTLYKGYIKTKGKKAIEAFKDRTKYRTYDEVKNLEGFGGVLADDTILIDIDDAEQSEILMSIVEEYQLDCRVYCTSRGRHFLFKNHSITRNRTHVPLDKSGVILGGDLNVVSPNEDINSAFLAISISHGNSKRELAKKAQGKSVVHIHNEEIKNLVVPFPAKAEQNKIVEYFSNLDDLITLHQRKLEKLQKSNVLTLI